MEEEKSMAMATVSKYKVSCTLGIIQFFVRISMSGWVGRRWVLRFLFKNNYYYTPGTTMIVIKCTVLFERSDLSVGG